MAKLSTTSEISRPTPSTLILPPPQAVEASALQGILDISTDPTEEQKLLLLGNATLSRSIRLNVNEQVATPIRNNLQLLSEALADGDNREVSRLFRTIGTQLSGLRDQDFRQGATADLKDGLRSRIPALFRRLSEQFAPPPDV